MWYKQSLWSQCKIFSFSSTFLFSHTKPCYLFIFFCYSMGHLWAVAPQECPCPAMSCPLTVFPWAALPQHRLPAHPLEYWAFCQDCLSSVHKNYLFLVFLCYWLFSFCVLLCLLLCPHFPLNMSEAVFRSFLSVLALSGHISVRAGGLDFGEICVMIFILK